MNQGASVLSALCDLNEFNVLAILLQEYWLTPENINKLKLFSNNYICYGISAMENYVGLNVLKGLPFGGVRTLLNSSLALNVKFKHCSERFVVVALTNILLINVYLP